jgi:glycosyltransferase involved in cell wall biosynthesis
VFDQFRANHLSKSDARQRLVFSNDLPIVLFFGIIRPYKGLKYLIDAIGILKQEGIRVRLVIAGEFWEDIKGYYHQLAQSGITDQVILVNRYISSEEVGLYFSAADIFAAPYIGGTQSGAVKTAMAFGLPLVLTDSLIDPLINELGSQMQAFPPGDAAAIANAIKIFLDSGCTAQPINQLITSSMSWNELVRVVESIMMMA